MANGEIVQNLTPASSITVNTQIAGEDEFYNITPDDHIDEAIMTYLSPNEKVEYVVIEERTIGCPFCAGTGIVEGRDHSFLNCPKCHGRQQISGKFAIRKTGKILKIKVTGSIGSTTNDNQLIEQPNLSVVYLIEPGDYYPNSNIWHNFLNVKSEWIKLINYTLTDHVRNCNGNYIEGLNIKSVEEGNNNGND